MQENERLLAAWEDGVPLSHAWLVFADEQNEKKFRELQRADSHLELQRLLENHLISRLQAGELKALGIEEGSVTGPMLIPKYYFSKTGEVDFDKQTLTALGRKFYETRVQWERQPPDETRPLRPVRWVHPHELEAQWELGPPSAPEPFPGEEWQWELLDETSPGEPEPSNEPLTQTEHESTEQAPSSEPTPTKFEEARSPGRPSKKPEIERAIQILVERDVPLASMPRKKAYKAVRACAAKELNSNIKIGFTDPVIHRSLFARFGPLR